LRRQTKQPAWPGRIRRLAALMGIVNIGILAAMSYVLYQLVQAGPHPVVSWISVVWNSLAAAAWLSLVLVALFLWGIIAAWRHGWWSWAGRAYYTVVAVVAVCWLPFIFYWDLLRPAW
jgi:hypothetical protein